MNFLAHFHLAWPQESLVAGGLEGDYFKGPLPGNLHPELERGVRLHRSIDAFTDTHPILMDLRGEMPDQLRRYAGILFDLSFDYYLSQHWTTFSKIPKAEFIPSIYKILGEWQQHLGDPSRIMIDRLIEYDILSLYDEWSTVGATAERIGERFSRGNPFINVDEFLQPARRKIEQAFLAFYPELQAFCANEISSAAPHEIATTQKSS